MQTYLRRFGRCFIYPDFLSRYWHYQKVGNQPLVVIGESMGGLVARYCLTDMERRGRTHQVGHYVSFDSPQLGANTPVGFQRLLLDISDNATPLNIAAALLTNELRRLRSPASRQMLLRFEGPNPHPDFTALQNEFNTLGFPRQGGIRNISIVNADENGGRQNPGVNFNPGDQIFEIAFTLYGVLTLRARTWTNQVNGASKVSAFSIFSGPIPSIRRESTYNFDAFNYDIAPGGWEDDQGTGDRNGWGLNIVNPIEWFSRTFNNFGRGEFAFIPLFSGVAYTGPLNNQNDIERSLADIENNNWTPFDVVYGDDENSPHIRAAFVQNRWNEFFRDELGLTINLACQPGAGIAAVPPPRFSVPKTYCPLELATFRISDASYVDNLYDYRWEVTGNSYRRTGTGETFSVRHDTPGVYTLRVTRSLRNGNGTPRVTTRTMTIVPRSNSKCDDAPPGDIDVRSAVSVEKPEGSDSTLVLVPTVRLWPNPTHGQLHIVYRMNEPGPVSITLTSAIDGRSQAAILPAIHRPMGNYEETYYTDQVNPGLYIVTVRTGRKVVQEKVFIK